MNLAKSCIYNVNSDSSINELAELMGCNIEEFPTIYLGLPLINSVLDGIPTYLMSLFPIPGSVEKKLNSMRSKFLWEGNSEKKKVHLVKWQEVIKDREVGGLGVKNLKIHNKSLLCK